MTDTPDKTDDPGHVHYWRANIKILIVLITAWFTASFGLGILAVDWLDQFHFLGFPLGFWIAQQGSIVAFLLIIAVYAIVMNSIDKKHGVEEEDTEGNEFEI